MEPYEAVGQLSRALAAPLRGAAVDLLAYRKLLVQRLAEATGPAQPLVSQRPRVLREVRLVRRGHDAVYASTTAHPAPIVGDAVAHATEHGSEEGPS
ncbi:transcriptional regulator [Plantactinospora sp. WMMC1484]|uniref:transcriptional regulator n=1 Tax=Plantactinospora sp. WMMC1484 TaxID=3404122 RepID=UPI003BF48A90